MITVNVKMLGISGTPIKGGNCDTMVQEALKSAAQVPGVEAEFLTLAATESISGGRETGKCNGG